MYNVDPADLTNAGMTLYYNRSGKAGNIKDEIMPPKDNATLFIGCGRADETMIQVGIMVDADDIFDDFEYPITETLAKPSRNFYTYFSTTRDYPTIGFSAVQQVLLNNWDLIDQVSVLYDVHRVSIMTGITYFYYNGVLSFLQPVPPDTIKPVG